MQVIRDEDIPKRKLAEGVWLQDKLTTDSFNIADVTIENGEYPVGKYAINEVCDIAIRGLKNHCSIQIKGQDRVGIGTGDILHIPAGTPYRYVAESVCVELMSSPPWTPQQYKEVEL